MEPWHSLGPQKPHKEALQTELGRRTGAAAKGDQVREQGWGPEEAVVGAEGAESGWQLLPSGQLFSEGGSQPGCVSGGQTRKTAMPGSSCAHGEAPAHLPQGSPRPPNVLRCPPA